MTTASEPAVLATALTRRFGRQLAVDRLDLAIPAGCVYGFLGPNGAGKTTTVRMLATLLRPDSGSARILGHDLATHPGDVRERISVTGQFAALDTDLTGRENLRMIGRLRGLRARDARTRADGLLDAFALAEAADRPVKGYSGGMARRLDIAAALVTRPELIFLDEPTTGLDPASRAQVWQAVRDLAGQGATVLLTTQYLDEADRLATRIGVIDHGRLIAEDTPARLRSAAGSGVLTVRLPGPARRGQAAEILARRLAAPVRTAPEPDTLTAPVADPARAAAALAELAAAGIEVAGFAHDQPSLDEVFLALTGGSPTAP